MSTMKLHPIYVALDGHQYSRAIKLALALPESHVLGKALLAHAYSKSGQRYESLLVLQSILGVDTFCELEHEIQYSLQARDEKNAVTSTTAAAAASASDSSSNKKGKKGKKGKSAAPKPAPVAATIAAAMTSPKQQKDWDWIEQLNTPPTLPEKWEELPSPETAITDETTLATLSVSLQSLKLPLTAYQLYAWACAADPNEALLTKTFCLGLVVLASPTKLVPASQTMVWTHVLQHLQGIALTWARLVMSAPPSSSSSSPNNDSAFPMMLTTAWAAQSALWQLQWLPHDEKRNLILPRLAESMTSRLVQQEESPSAEIQWLCLRTLEQQSKYPEMLELLETLPTQDSETPPTSEFGVALTPVQVLQEKARVMIQLEQYEAAVQVYETLLAKSPDDWSSWKGHLQCAEKTSGGTQQTQEWIAKAIAKRQEEDSKYPLRGPHLMKVEVLAHAVRSNAATATPDLLDALSTAIQTYAELFAPRASCAFSDLETYLELLLLTTSETPISTLETLLQFADSMRLNSASNESNTNKERQSKLRAHIFAARVTHKILAKRVELQAKWMPNWKDLVTEWQTSLTLSSSNEGEESQREARPGDELLLLSVQQLLYQESSSTESLVTAAILLETAINHSPHNAYLQIAAIDVYYHLNAMSRAWELFHALGIKHIQLDSCTYTILPLLMAGGLYNETIEVSNALLRFHAGTARDCSEYAGRAMEAGTLSKANEFLVFQREKMNKSVTVLQAKGLILDSAAVLANVVPRKKHDDDPMLEGALGVYQGIVGGDADMGRATQMVAEAHNPYVALTLVSWADSDGSIDDGKDMADNRDLSILSQQILYQSKVESKEDIVQAALRRGHIHGLLIRSTLCVDATKGPKKGKIVKSSTELEKRTSSLLDCVKACTEFVDNHTLAEGSEGECCKALMRATMALSRTLAMVSAGLPTLEKDSLEEREKLAAELLHSQVTDQLKQAKEHLTVLSVKDVCSLLPNYVVPLFALFRMCSNMLTLFGWGRRKRTTKICAGAMADLALAFAGIVQELQSCVESLPASETSEGAIFKVKEEHLPLLDEAMVSETKRLLVAAQYRTRVRVEPILKEMKEELDSFDIKD